MSKAKRTATSSKEFKGADSSNEITIAVSLRALFNLENYKYPQHAMPIPGVAFPFVKALKNTLAKQNPSDKLLVNIVITVPEAERVNEQLENIIQYFGRLMRYNDTNLLNLLIENKTKLYLSINSAEVANAINQGIAAATLFTPEARMELSESELRVAFDGDGVIFSDEAEKVMKTKGLKAFLQHEELRAETPLPEGPLKCFLEVLVQLQKNRCPIRTFLVTSREALIAGRRALNTLRGWDLNINEMIFLEGSPKGSILQAIKPHVFFDDQMKHVLNAKEAGVVAAHVPYGISQEYN
ncbi:cytosolic 5'-nucleotidase 1A-like [Pangasianodon hypophthalmus]|uniref:cytosolic 5'-nucleotidase 1A-like n=1 Tax=Pangasianodon hypophthalmus TaxID=310915 RepID=UPI000EFF8098|nr:cytosolic 5'-nucleotidase 1A-like [Pangasianodon hypophthalmus]